MSALRSAAFGRAAWLFLGYNVLVIVWGGLVRATGSGAGCGSHWPLCNGVWVPQGVHLDTLIELIHRGMSGVALGGVVALWLWSRKVFPADALARVGAAASIGFMLSEAAIGAGLVLLKLVAQDTSLLRAAYLSIHLLNTFLLIAALTLTVWGSTHPLVSWRVITQVPRALIGGLLGTLLLGITGGIAALGDTLFPSRTLQEGLAGDFNSGAHFLIRLRVFHPVIAIIVAMYLMLLGLGAIPIGRQSQEIVWGKGLLIVIGVQLFIGIWNLAWLAPIGLQLTHLAMADILWIVLILFTLEFAPQPQRGA